MDRKAAAARHAQSRMIRSGRAGGKKGKASLSELLSSNSSETLRVPDPWRRYTAILPSMTDGATSAATPPPHGVLAPGSFDRTVIAMSGGMPHNWLGMRLAIALRRLVTTRLRGDPGFDVTRWGLRLRLHPLRNGCEKGLLFTPQFYEAGEREELEKRIVNTNGRPFVFVDIGANV